MGTSLATLLAQLGEHAQLTAFIALAVGGLLTALKPWIPAEDDIRQRVKLKQIGLIEKCAAELVRVLELSRDDDSPLRASPPQEDLPGIFAKTLFLTVEQCATLKQIRESVRNLHTALLWLTILALILFLASINADARLYLGIVCIAVIFSEVFIVIRLRAHATALERHEQTE